MINHKDGKILKLRIIKLNITVYGLFGLYLIKYIKTQLKVRLNKENLTKLTKLLCILRKLMGDLPVHYATNWFKRETEREINGEVNAQMK